MTRQKSFKQRIRARMDKTGESYATARRHLIDKAETEARKRRTPETIAPTRTNAETMLSNTGRSREEWFELLDAWGAKDRKHPEIARWLVEEHGVDGWWSQHLTVAYEQERGMRAPGQRADGTYGASASKTINAPADQLFDAFNDERARARWLGDFELSVRTARRGKSMTAVWEDGSRLAIGFIDRGASKAQVSLGHERLADARRADEMKAFWRGRLSALKDLMES